MTNPNYGKGVLLNGVAYERLADGTLRPFASKTDWARIDAMTDEELTANAESDPDSIPYTDEEWAAATVIRPGKVSVGIRLDSDLLDWFKKRGSGYQTRINSVLRRYVEAQKKTG